MAIEKVQLSDCPANLQDAVNKYVGGMPEIELLSVQRLVTTPYKDKTITNTTHRVFTQHGNYFCVFKTTACSKEKWSDREVSKSCMIAGEIAEIVELCPVWFK